jgi:hypothetical protein
VTFSGSWRYLEYPEVNTAGSYLFEPGESDITASHRGVRAQVARHPGRKEEDERVAQQEDHAENEQGADAQEPCFVRHLADDGADVVCPEGSRGDQPRNRAGNEQRERIEAAIGVPRLPVTDEPRGRGPPGGGHAVAGAGSAAPVIRTAPNVDPSRRTLSDGSDPYTWA